MNKYRAQKSGDRLAHGSSFSAAKVAPPNFHALPLLFAISLRKKEYNDKAHTHHVFRSPCHSPTSRHALNINMDDYGDGGEEAYGGEYVCSMHSILHCDGPPY